MDYTLRSAGEKMMMPSDMSMPANQEYFQNIRFTLEQLPEISSWQVGQEYTLIIKVRQTELSIEKEADKINEHAEFDVLAVGAIKDAPTDYKQTVKAKLKL